MFTLGTRLAGAGRALRHPIMVPRYFKARRNLLYLRYRQRRNHGVFSVNLQKNNGFFAQISWCPYILSFCHAQNLIPHVTITNPRYTDPRRGADCLAYFFENPEQEFIDANVVETVGIGKLSQLGLPSRYMRGMTLEHASMLVKRHMRVRQEVVDAVERFWRAHFDGGVVLGVHFRGTDKHEAPRVSYEHCAQAITRFLNHHPEVDRIFVASDESPFVQFMRKEFRSIPVSFCDDQRSDGTLAVHHRDFGGDNYEKGREALVNCLLLARCSVLIRTASALSGWASVFNPQLRVIMLNRPYPQCLWFPDKLVIAKASMAEL